MRDQVPAQLLKQHLGRLLPIPLGRFPLPSVTRPSSLGEVCSELMQWDLGRAG